LREPSHARRVQASGGLWTAAPKSGPDRMAIPEGAEQVPARVGGIGVYATPAALVAYMRTRSERAMRTLLTFAGTVIATPLGFLIPPHAEPAFVVFMLGLYFTRRAWVAEWEVVSMSGTCPRCEAALVLRRGTVLYIPHTLRCAACRSELWLDIGAAPEVDEAMRQAAIAKAAEPVQPGALGGRPPLTWSPGASDWRDRPTRRDPT
jgi:hypothetical protein